MINAVLIHRLVSYLKPVVLKITIAVCMITNFVALMVRIVVGGSVVRLVRLVVRVGALTVFTIIVVTPLQNDVFMVMVATVVLVLQSLQNRIHKDSKLYPNNLKNQFLNIFYHPQTKVC